jgi:hypothetical protein
VNQAVRFPIRFHAPVELPSPAVPAVPIAKPLNGHTIETVRCSIADDESDFVKAYYATRWLVVERDPANGLIRESTGTYADERAAYYAYWHASADEPLDFEPWVSLIFATHAAAA